MVCAEGRGSGARLAAVLGRGRAGRPVSMTPPARRGADLDRPGRPGRGRTPRARLPRARRQAGRPGRGRPHRPPPGPPPARPRARTADDVLRRPDRRATTSCTTSTAWPASAGMVQPRRSAGSSATTCCSSTGAATSSTCPSDQIDAAHAPTRAASRPPLNRLDGSGVAADQGPGPRRGPRDRPGARRAVPDAGHTSPGHAFAPDTPWQREIEDVVPLHRDARPAQGHRGRQGRHGGGRARWTAWCAATSASARPRWPCGPSSRRSRTASRSPCSCRPPCWPSSTSRPSPTASPATRSGSRCCRRFLTPAQAREVVDGLADGSVDVVIGTHRLLVGRRHVQGPRACSWSTRSSASASATRRRSRSCAPAWTC